MADPIKLHPRVTRTLAARRPVVALESAILAHGLPRPDNLRVAREIEAAVRESGAQPATVAVLDGVIRVGLDDAELERVCYAPGVAKLGVRDLPAAVALRGTGATTVASTALVAARSRIGVMATGGLGGVHRGASETFDESADLAVLATTPLAVVCSGVKSVLDVGATLERLETLSVLVLGFQTDRFPAFYLTDSGHRLDWRVEAPDQVAAVLRARDQLGLTGAVVVANPLPPQEQLDPTLHEQALHTALAQAREVQVHGKDVTPFLLDRLHRDTGAASVQVNIRLIMRNAWLAGHVAAAVSGL